MAKDYSNSVLVGDIGGTNMRFACATSRPGEIGVDIEEFWKTANDNHDSFESGLEAYLETHPHRPKRAVFAIAGPIKNNTVDLTNRDWTVSGQLLKTMFDFDEVLLINDFVAMARSVPELQDHQYKTLYQTETTPTRPITVAGAGTGFGLATLVPRGDDWSVIAGEGGHMAYSPRNALELELLSRLQKEYEYVSVEAVTGGKFFRPVLKALYEIHGRPYEDLSPQDTLTLAAKGDETCLTLCHVRANAIMTACGDAALATGSRGGLMLAGGVTERLLPYITRPEAMNRFFDRGPMSSFMTGIQISIIKCDEAPLIGAAVI